MELPLRLNSPQFDVDEVHQLGNSPAGPHIFPRQSHLAHIRQSLGGHCLKVLHRGVQNIHNQRNPIEIHNGLPYIDVQRDVGEDREGAQTALGVAALQDIDQDIESTDVRDGELIDLGAQIVVLQAAQRYYSGCLIARLDVLHQLLDVVVVGRNFSGARHLLPAVLLVRVGLHLGGIRIVGRRLALVLGEPVGTGSALLPYLPSAWLRSIAALGNHLGGGLGSRVTWFFGLCMGIFLCFCMGDFVGYSIDLTRRVAGVTKRNFQGSGALLRSIDRSRTVSFLMYFFGLINFLII